MLTFRSSGKTDHEGVLHLDFPLGRPNGEFEVIVVLQPKIPGESTPAVVDPTWAEFVGQTAGSIQDETFRRYDQGESEERLDVPQPKASVEPPRSEVDPSWAEFIEQTAGRWEGDFIRDQGRAEQRDEF